MGFSGVFQAQRLESRPVDIPHGLFHELVKKGNKGYDLQGGPPQPVIMTPRDNGCYLMVLYSN